MHTEQEDTTLEMESTEAGELRQRVRQLRLCVVELLATNQSLRARLLNFESPHLICFDPKREVSF